MTQYAGCYSLVVHCDRASECAGVPPGNNEGAQADSSGRQTFGAAVLDLRRSGWRIRTARHRQIVAAMCPACLRRFEA